MSAASLAVAFSSVFLRGAMASGMVQGKVTE